ncbi:hypothetical protein HGRIS_007054 [Hohenbuehelia grisea]|uniref:Uncharacterized protein n=1 Tax=Hohenbuehelia grisea TaxID=104357 RepID=A0ABR3JB06_9AGAR
MRECLRCVAREAIPIYWLRLLHSVSAFHWLRLFIGFVFSLVSSFHWLRFLIALVFALASYFHWLRFDDGAVLLEALRGTLVSVLSAQRSAFSTSAQYQAARRQAPAPHTLRHRTWIWVS